MTKVYDHVNTRVGRAGAHTLARGLADLGVVYDHVNTRVGRAGAHTLARGLADLGVVRSVSGDE
ncbi:hypothetical protein J6590_049103 [Homalodisca vitripennis]|nr:hypothetical protein J6590_049103 [Homalodisca vitripennis]